MKTAKELRTHVINAIGSTLLGTRSYGAIVEPAISIIPDPQFADGGFTFPSIINGNPVVNNGIEVVIYDGYEGNDYSAIMNNGARLDSEISILIKDWNDSDNSKITQAALLISKGLYIVRTIKPPSTNIDQAPLLRSIVLVVGYSGYL